MTQETGTEGVDRSVIVARLMERRRTGLLGDIREAIFGAQNGLVSTLGSVLPSLLGGPTVA